MCGSFNYFSSGIPCTLHVFTGSPSGILEYTGSTSGIPVAFQCTLDQPVYTGSGLGPWLADATQQLVWWAIAHIKPNVLSLAVTWMSDHMITSCQPLAGRVFVLWFDFFSSFTQIFFSHDLRNSHHRNASRRGNVHPIVHILMVCLEQKKIVLCSMLNFAINLS